MELLQSPVVMEGPSGIASSGDDINAILDPGLADEMGQIQDQTGVDLHSHLGSAFIDAPPEFIPNQTTAQVLLHDLQCTGQEKVLSFHDGEPVISDVSGAPARDNSTSQTEGSTDVLRSDNETVYFVCNNDRGSQEEQPMFFLPPEEPNGDVGTDSLPTVHPIIDLQSDVNGEEDAPFNISLLPLDVQIALLQQNQEGESAKLADSSSLSSLFSKSTSGQSLRSNESIRISAEALTLLMDSVQELPPRTQGSTETLRGKLLDDQGMQVLEADDAQLLQELGVESSVSQEESVGKKIKDNTNFCDICFKSFANLGCLTTHRKVHDKNVPRAFKCGECGASFKQKACLQTHSIKHSTSTPFQCHVCERNFKMASNLKKHMFCHTGEKRKVHTCSVCKKIFSKASYLQRHMRVHSGEKPYKCDVCGIGFAVAGTLTRHMLVHSQEKAFVCDVCGKTFARRGDERRHNLQHFKKKKPTKEKRKPVVAPKHSFAPLSVGDQASVVNGDGYDPIVESKKKTVIGASTEAAPTKQPVLDDQREESTVRKRSSPQETDNCASILESEPLIGLLTGSQDQGDALVYEYASQDALPVAEPDSQAIASTDPTLPPGEELFANFVRKNQLSFLQEENVKSSAESKRSDSANRLPAARASTHGEIPIYLQSKLSSKSKPFACLICERDFNKESTLARHMYSHSEDMPHRCTVCFMGFFKLDNLRQHVRSMHTKNTPLKCPQCGKGFQTASQVRKHMSSHSEDRLYKCTICSKYLKTKNSLSKHMESHVKAEQLWQCDQCRRKFVSENDLSQHQCVEPNRSCKLCGKFCDSDGQLTEHLHTHIKLGNVLPDERHHQCASSANCDHEEQRLKSKKRSKACAQAVCESSMTRTIAHKIRGDRCPICSLYVSDVTTLHEHINEHLLPDRGYQCKVCSKEFATSDDLVNHRHLHVGQPRHTCAICRKQFIDQCNLTRHWEVHVKRGERLPSPEKVTKQSLVVDKAAAVPDVVTPPISSSS